MSTRASSLLHVKVRPPAVRGLTQQIGFPLAVLCVTGNGVIGEILGRRGGENWRARVLGLFIKIESFSREGSGVNRMFRKIIGKNFCKFSNVRNKVEKRRILGEIYDTLFQRWVNIN